MQDQEGPHGSELLTLELGNGVGWAGVGVGTETLSGWRLLSRKARNSVSGPEAACKRESSGPGPSWQS